VLTRYLDEVENIYNSLQQIYPGQ